MTTAAHEAPCEPVTLAELRPMLALFAQAFAGRTVALRDGSDRREGTPTRRPGPATNAVPLDVTLPPRIVSHPRARDNRAAYRLAVMRQVLGTSTDPLLAAAHAAASPPWQRLFGALERLRVDATIERSYPGAQPDLARQRTLELAQRRNGAARRWAITRALEALWRHALGDRNDPCATVDAAVWHALRQCADALRRSDAGPLDSARAATSICSLLGVRTQRRWCATDLPRNDGAAPALLSATGPHAAGADAVNTRDAEDAAAAAFAPSAARTADRAGGSRAHGGSDVALAASPATGTPPRLARTAQQRQQAHPRVPRPALLLPGDGGEPPGTVHSIDEWDYRQQRLLPAWCTLVERRLRGSDTTFIGRVRERHAGLARRVHRQFAAWRPEGLQRVHGASDGDELELDRVIEAVVDLRAGLFDDRAWYVRRDRAQRDVATAFLVDTSASTDFVLPDGVVGPPRPAPSPQADTVYLYDLAVSAPPAGPAKRRVIDVAKEALALMCDALHALGDCFAVYTFSGHGRAHVDLRVVKPFHETVSSRTAAALAALRPHGATRTGAAIRHTVAQLLRQPQRRRALIVVTDGYPEDVDYGPTPRDLQYGLEDTAHALCEAQDAGVQTFCLSIDPAGHDYLRRMCARERYLVIGDLAALPGELAKVYQAMTRPVV